MCVCVWGGGGGGFLQIISTNNGSYDSSDMNIYLIRQLISSATGIAFPYH